MNRPPDSPFRIVSGGVSGTNICGVRDHAYLLASELRAQGHSVHQVWAQPKARKLSHELSRWMDDVETTVSATNADVLVVHYSAFSFARRGVPYPVLPLALRLRRLPVPVVTVLHELVYPWHRRGWHGIALAGTQRVALRPLVVSSSELVTTTAERAEWTAGRWWLPQRPITCVPVFSNIAATSSPLLAAAPPYIAIFGYGSQGDLCGPTVEAVSLAAEKIEGLRLVLVGGSGRDAPSSAGWVAACQRYRCPLEFTGPLPPDDLSLVLASALIAVFPDSAGPTSRKGTLAALLSHGCPTIAFRGIQTWNDLVESDCVLMVTPTADAITAAVVRLARDGESRRLLGQRARHFYDERMSVGQAGNTFLQVIARAVRSDLGRPTLQSPTADFGETR